VSPPQLITPGVSVSPQSLTFPGPDRPTGAEMSTLLTADDARLRFSEDPAVAVGQLESAELVQNKSRVRDEILGHIERHTDIASRTCRPGHLTGSAVVVDSIGERALLMLHAKLGRWFQPGGHADGDMNLAAVALREA